jgi:hypothetical protein
LTTASFYIKIEMPTRGRAVEARRAHNPEVVGSSPTPATKEVRHGFLPCFLPTPQFLIVARIPAAVPTGPPMFVLLGRSRPLSGLRTTPERSITLAAEYRTGLQFRLFHVRIDAVVIMTISAKASGKKSNDVDRLSGRAIICYTICGGTGNGQ